MEINENKKEQWSQIISINGTEIKFKLDAGGDVNVLPYYMYILAGLSPR